MNIVIKSWLKVVHSQMVLISPKHLVANSTFFAGFDYSLTLIKELFNRALSGYLHEKISGEQTYRSSQSSTTILMAFTTSYSPLLQNNHKDTEVKTGGVN